MTYTAGNEMVNAKLIFEKAQLRPSMHIADFGCGRTGHLVFSSAALLGEQGVVYAIDILKDILTEIKKRSELNNQLTIHPVWADVEQIGACSIPEHSLDVIFMVNVLVQTKDVLSVLQEGARLLKDKGRIIVVDWQTKGLAFSPNDLHHVDFTQITHWAKQNNFLVQEKFVAGRYHKGLVLYRHV